jgi:hypothetical protein
MLFQNSIISTMSNVDEIWESMKGAENGTTPEKVKSLFSLWESGIMRKKKSFSHERTKTRGSENISKDSDITRYIIDDSIGFDSDDDSDDESPIMTGNQTNNMQVTARLRLMVRNKIKRQEGLHAVLMKIQSLNLDRILQADDYTIHGLCSTRNESNTIRRPLTAREKDQMLVIAQNILDSVGKDLFACLSDKAERCRLLATKCISELCHIGIDISRTLGYLLPCIFSKFDFASYDPDAELFVHNFDQHLFYNRGGAMQRQDKMKVDMRSSEPSEEVRLGYCDILSSVITSCSHSGSMSLLDPYFTDIVLTLHSCFVADPCDDVKFAAGMILSKVVQFNEWEVGAKHFATAIARSAIPLLRHRKAKIRIISLELFEKSVCVPFREKKKGAGTDAINDLIGFKDDNIIPIAAFYKSECALRVNVLAEISADSNCRMRRKCCQVLTNFMCHLPDRYDHQQKLLPYILLFHEDDDDHIRDMALNCIHTRGQQYEEEHYDEIVERVQFGVDGDSRCNHIDPLPSPFDGRPKLAERLFVRGNSKRFLEVLLNELGNWIPATRIQSTKLLRILVVYCEEHLTMDIQKIIIGLVKVLNKSLSEPECKEKSQLKDILKEVLVLIGRFVDPNIYCKVILRRAVDSATEIDSTVSSSTFTVYMIALRYLIHGSLPKRVLTCFSMLFSSLTSDKVLENFPMKTRYECLVTLLAITEKVKGCSIAGSENDIFQESGRLVSIPKAAETSLRSIQLHLHNIDPNKSDYRNVATKVVDHLQLLVVNKMIDI